MKHFGEIAMEQYKEWQVYEAMPEGFRLDKSAGSPLHGYEFITNGSPLKGGVRSLLRVHLDALRVCTPSCQVAKTEQPEETKQVQIIDENYCKTVNELARKKFEMRLLADISVDLMVCEIEGWDKMEYIEELKALINGLVGRSNGVANNQFDLTYAKPSLAASNNVEKKTYTQCNFLDDEKETK
jgi:hypothetical protein